MDLSQQPAKRVRDDLLVVVEGEMAMLVRGAVAPVYVVDFSLVCVRCQGSISRSLGFS